MTTPRQELGLDVLWRLPLPSWVTAPPARLGELVIVRCGDVVQAFSPQDRTQAWSRTLVEEPSSGQLAAGDGAIAANHRLKTRATRFYVLDDRGQRVSDFGAEGHCVRGGLWFEGRTLRALMSVRSELAVRTFDVDKGELAAEYYTPDIGTDEVVKHDRGDVLTAKSGRAEGVGLFLREADTGNTTRIRDERVWAHALWEQQLLVTIGPHKEVRTLEAFDFRTLRPLWQLAGVAGGVGAGAPGIACFKVEADTRPAILDPETREVRWTGEPCEDAPVDLAFKGPLLLANEVSGIYLYDTRTGELLGSGEGFSRDCAAFEDQLIFTHDEHVLGLEIPGA